MELQYLFHCKNCGRPILLPFETFEPLPEDQVSQPTDFPQIAFADHHCKHVDSYVLQYTGPRPSNEEGMAILAPQTVDVRRVDTLKCEVASCDTPLPLYAHRNAASIPLAQWHVANMTCKRGHPIPVPVLRLVLEEPEIRI